MTFRRLLLLGAALVLGIAAGWVWTQGETTPDAPPPAPPTPTDEPPTPDPAPQPPAGPEGRFEDVTEAAGIRFVHHVGDEAMDNIIEAIGPGALWFDADGDGWLDLYLLDQGWREGLSDGTRSEDVYTNRLFRNRGDGIFEDVTERAGVGDTGYGISACAADIDGDGDVDLYVLNDGPNVLYRNRGDGRFEDVTERAGVAGDLCSVGGTFFDIEGDGDLDLYVGNYLIYDPTVKERFERPGPTAYVAQPDVLYVNQGDGIFVDGTEAAGMAMDADLGRVMGVIACDFTGDGKTDLFVANDRSANFLFENQGDGTFVENGLLAGVAYGFHGEATGSMAGTVADYDGDQVLDMLVTDTSYGALYRGEGGGMFQDRIRSAGIAAPAGQWPSWGGGFVDFDNDGFWDIYTGSGGLHAPVGRADLLLRNLGNGKFEDVSTKGGPYFRTEHCTRGGAFADYDNDGDLDVLVTNIDGAPVLLRNRGTPDAHWITLSLKGTKGHPEGYGARVTVHAGARRFVQVAHLRAGYLTQSDPRLHFGLGAETRVDRVVVVWPSGEREEHMSDGAGFAANRFYVLEEGGGLR